jgi:serine/threonine protein kinase
MTLREGDCFDHFQIRAHMAQGGIGDIYGALDVLTGREVALKIPIRATIIDPAQYEFFLREVDAMRILQHPAVQCGIDSGRFDNSPYLVTELVAGKSIGKLIAQNGPFQLNQAVALTRQIVEGLAYCHQQGIIHRDVKPDNILVTDGGQPVIIDFGLALTRGRPGAGKAAGTPYYMAPEQFQGQQGDARTDVYALGITLYEMLVGVVPFTGLDAVEIMSKHLYAAIPRLDKVRPELSPQIATVVAKCLQRDPDQRYSDMHALLNDLDRLDEVNTQELDALTCAPSAPSFFQTQMGQVLLILIAFIVGTASLTLLAVTLKPGH